MAHPLDNPLWTALTGPQAYLAERRGSAARFPVDASPSATVAGPAAGDQRWADLAALVGPGGVAVVPDAPEETPPGWERLGAIPGVQMDGSGLEPAPEPEAVVLGPGGRPRDAGPRRRTRPGPVLARTPELGTYLGIRGKGALVAMAGSGCSRRDGPRSARSAPTPRPAGRGSPRVWSARSPARIGERGEGSFLHVAAANTGAIALYERLGFTHRRDILFAAMQAAQRSESNSEAMAAQWRSSAARS